MQITVIDKTENPVDVISLAAGTCYGKDDVSERRVTRCFNNGHLSVFEHAYFVAKVDGISRACSHQLVRHRLASFCQESQRYTKYDPIGDGWYVMPEDFKGVRLEEFTEQEYRDVMSGYAFNYRSAVKSGVKPEDARYLLPEAMKTSIVVTMNVRELFHFLDVRTDKAAQWEIRSLAWNLFHTLRLENDQWETLMLMWEAGNGTRR